jgi:hypothetical protein
VNQEKWRESINKYAYLDFFLLGSKILNSVHNYSAAIIELQNLVAGFF